MKANAVVALFLAVSFAGCSSSAIVIMSDYRGQTISGKSLLVNQFAPVILNGDDVTDDLGAGVPDEVFMSFFEKEATSQLHTRSSFGPTVFAKTDTKAPLVERRFKLSADESIKLNLPADGTSAAYDSVMPDFILFIGQMVVSRGAGSAGTWTPGFGNGPGFYSGGSMGDLKFTVPFAFWDNAQGRLVSYGHAESKSEITFFAMTKGNWESCVREFIGNIVKDTPFQRGPKSKSISSSVTNQDTKTPSISFGD